MKIVVVEDEKPLAEALKEKFSQEGHETFVAQNGVEGLELVLKEKPDVTLLDLVMPHKDGISMLRELREDSWGKDARVIVLTNMNDPVHIADVLEAGASEYFVKTEWNLADLLDHLIEKVS